MELKIFRKEVLEHRFRRTTEQVAIRGFGPIAWLVIAMILAWGLFAALLTTNDYVLRERFVGLTADASDRYIDPKKFPEAKIVGIIIIPRDSAGGIVAGTEVELTFFGEELAGLPPISVRIAGIADTSLGKSQSSGRNMLGIAVFPDEVYLAAGREVSIKAGSMFNAHVRTRRVSMLRLMLAPMKKLTAGRY